MTLGFNHIGRLGQLGNQMFQYASLKGIARRNGYEYIIHQNEAVDDGLGNRLRTELFDPFDLEVKSGIIETDKYWKEPHFHFSEEFLNTCPDNVSLWGFFQTEKYFRHIRDELLEDFTFKHEILEPCREMMSQFNEPPISVHVRRGDFLINSGNHYNLSLDYYENAISLLPRVYDSCNLPVLVFSDDPDWCKEQKLFEDDRFMISEGNSAYVDMCLMSMCSWHVIANSSFSWWGAWLSDSKKVIAPSKWFGPNNASNDTKDLYCEGWIIL